MEDHAQVVLWLFLMLESALIFALLFACLSLAVDIIQSSEKLEWLQH